MYRCSKNSITLELFIQKPCLTQGFFFIYYV